jgi:hypothetical protein
LDRYDVDLELPLEFDGEGLGFSAEQPHITNALRRFDVSIVAQFTSPPEV